MMYRFSWKRCIGFHPKSWKRGLWNGNIGCSQQTKTWYYFSCSTRGVLHPFWLSHIFPKGLGREPPTIRGLFTLKLSQLSESTVVVILCFVCVGVCGGVDSMQFVSTFQSRCGFKKNSGFNQKKQDWPWIPCSWRTAQWKIPLPKRGEKSPRYHLVHKKWPGV